MANNRDDDLVPGGNTFTQILSTLALTLGNQGAKHAVSSWISNLQKQRDDERDFTQKADMFRQKQEADKLEQAMRLRVSAAGSGIPTSPEMGGEDLLAALTSYHAPDAVNARTQAAELAKVMGPAETVKLGRANTEEADDRKWQETQSRKRFGENIHLAGIRNENATAQKVTGADIKAAFLSASESVRTAKIQQDELFDKLKDEEAISDEALKNLRAKSQKGRVTPEALKAEEEAIKGKYMADIETLNARIKENSMPDYEALRTQ